MYCLLLSFLVWNSLELRFLNRGREVLLELSIPTPRFGVSYEENRFLQDLLTKSD